MSGNNKTWVEDWSTYYNQDGLSKGRVELFRHAKVLIRVQLTRATKSPPVAMVGEHGDT